jgi:hypothetical protein
MEATIPQTAGRVSGTIVRYAIQANRQIDWAEVLETFLHGLQVLVAGAMVAYGYARQAWVNLPAWSERLGKVYSQLTVGSIHDVTEVEPEAATVAPVAPYQHSLLSIADGLQSLTVAQLKAMVGTKRKLTKAQLIAMVVAC